MDLLKLRNEVDAWRKDAGLDAGTMMGASLLSILDKVPPEHALRAALDASIEKQAALEIYGRVIDELFPDFRASGTTLDRVLAATRLLRKAIMSPRRRGMKRLEGNARCSECTLHKPTLVCFDNAPDGSSGWMVCDDCLRGMLPALPTPAPAVDAVSEEHGEMQRIASLLARDVREVLDEVRMARRTVPEAVRALRDIVATYGTRPPAPAVEPSEES